MLEALAKARRAQFGDDPKMSNPTRARLHEEIARVGASEEENIESRPSWLTMFWPRLTIAAAVATLVVLVPAFLWNRSHPVAESGDLALRSRTAAAANRVNRAAPAAGVLANAPATRHTEATVNLADNNQIKIEPGATPAAAAEALASSARILQDHAVTGSQSEITKGLIDKEIASAKIQEAPAAAPPPGADLKAKSDRIAAAAPSAAQRSTTQQFSQRPTFQSFRNNAQVSQPPNVLNTFQVQQEGSDIRVVDADGSTYTGKIEHSAKDAELDSRVTAGRAMAKQTQRRDAQAGGEAESAAPQPHFRATGFNLTLKKRLVFEGNYAAPPAQQPAKMTSNDRDRAEPIRDRARIVGTVRVNGETPVQVDAIAETAEPAATKKSEQ